MACDEMNLLNQSIPRHHSQWQLRMPRPFLGLPDTNKWFVRMLHVAAQSYLIKVI